MDESPQPDTQNMNTAEPDSAAEAQTPKLLGGAEKIKRVFFQVLITCLLGAAAIAVVAVLIGRFNDVLGRALGTIALVALHAILSFGYITETEKRIKKDGPRSIELFTNAVFALIVISFITSVFAVWQLIDGHFTLQLYMAYGVLLFATLHCDVLYRIRGFEKKIDNIVVANYLFIATVVTMLFIVIFAKNASALGEYYYRVLAASGIIDATMTITAIIMHKLFLQKHPELVEQSQEQSPKSKSFWKNPLVVLLIIFLAFQIIGSLVALLMSGF